MKTLPTLFLTLFAFTYAIAQTGQYDVRLVQEHPFQCGDAVIYFDIQLKASNAATTFRVSEQNYRFDYDSLALTNPRLDQELGLSGTVNDGIGTSTYNIHTLYGTLGSTVSYNVELASGTGYLLTDKWMPIGRIAFDIIDAASCLNITWRTLSDFPITFIGTIDSNGILLETNEGNYDNYVGCLPDICINCPISLNLSYVIPDNTYQADIDIVSDGTIPDGGTVNYRAGENISLGNGFSVKAQADFSAHISDCGN